MRSRNRLLPQLFFIAFLALPSPAPAKPFAFAVFADNQPEEYLLRYRELTGAIVRDIAARKPAFVITAGDHIRGYVYNEPTMRTMWRAYARLVAPLEGIPVHNVVGNHDIWDEASGRLWDEYMGKRYHSWEHERNLFIALDAETDTNAVTGEQLEWLRKTLARSSRYDNVFVTMHKPFLRPRVNGEIQEYHQNIYTRPAEERVLLDLLAGSGIRMAFVGHYHRYDVDYREGILQFITGGAGGGLDGDGGPNSDFHHYLWVEVDGKKVDVKVVRPDLSGAVEKQAEKSVPAVLEDFEGDDGPNAWDLWDEKVRAVAAPMPDGRGGRGLGMSWDFSGYEWPMLMLGLEPVVTVKGKPRRLAFDVFVPEGTPTDPPLAFWVTIGGRNGEYSFDNLQLDGPGRHPFSLPLAEKRWKWGNRKQGKDKKEITGVAANLAKIGPLTSVQWALSGYGRKESGTVYLDNFRLE